MLDLITNAYSNIMKKDYFELDRVVEDLAKTCAAPCSTTWFKVTDNKSPSEEEYRKKVVHFLKEFGRLVTEHLPVNEQSDHFKGYVNRQINQQIHLIQHGSNKEVERRYKYYVDYHY